MGHAGLKRRSVYLAVAGLVLSGFTACGGGKVSQPATPSQSTQPQPTTFLQTFQDSSGSVSTFSQGPVDLSGPLFSKLGTNGRTCASCHDSGDGWSITPAHLQQRFDASQGMDPVFRPVDGANCPSADVSTTTARSSAYSLLLTKGLIRISLPVPANAEFSIVSINDPYQCPDTTTSQPALYRRPLPSTNLRFLNGIMWDGREPDLRTQAINAALIHSQATQPPTDSQLQQILSLENSLFTAQSQDNLAGDLSAGGAKGGVMFLSTQPFFPGMNTGAGFDSNVFSLYTNWTSASGTNGASQQSIASGERLFNHQPIRITSVPGFNDIQGETEIIGTCSTCHNTPNVGGNSAFAMMNIGTGSPKTDLPSYLMLCNDGSQVLTTDPGRAMVTGKCDDIGKFKIPGLRGLPARAPYFHNGTAETLLDVVNFYDQRFGMLLTDDEKADLVAFLGTL